VQFHTVVDPDEATKAGLKSALRLSSLSFPLVFVRAVFLGGMEQLQGVISDGRLGEMLHAEVASTTGGFRRAADPVRLLTGASRQRWYVFQLTVYTNYIRVLSAVHCAIFCLGILAYSCSWPPWIARAAYWCMLVDLVIFFVSGPTPIAPISTIVIVLIWRSRGNAATSLPYKVVFGYYAYTLGYGLFTEPGTISQGSLSALLLNSLLLAVFRF